MKASVPAYAPMSAVSWAMMSPEGAVVISGVSPLSSTRVLHPGDELRITLSLNCNYETIPTPVGSFVSEQAELGPEWKEASVVPPPSFSPISEHNEQKVVFATRIDAVEIARENV